MNLKNIFSYVSHNEAAACSLCLCTCRCFLLNAVSKHWKITLFFPFHQLTKLPYAVKALNCILPVVERRRRRSDVICCQKCLATQQSAGRPLKAITCWLIFMGTTEHTGKQHSSGAHRHISVWPLIFHEGEVVSQHVEFILEHKPLCTHCRHCCSCLAMTVAIFRCHF